MVKCDRCRNLMVKGDLLFPYEIVTNTSFLGRFFNSFCVVFVCEHCYKKILDRIE